MPVWVGSGPPVRVEGSTVSTIQRGIVAEKLGDFLRGGRGDAIGRAMLGYLVRKLHVTVGGDRVMCRLNKEVPAFRWWRLSVFDPESFRHMIYGFWFFRNVLGGESLWANVRRLHLRPPLGVFSTGDA